MILIGEKINGFIPSVAEAIKKKDTEWIRQLALSQNEAGVSYLDCCASGKERETEELLWLVQCVQDSSKLPICLDSANPEVLEAVIPHCQVPGIVNSVSLEGTKADRIFALLAQDAYKAWGVVALLMNEQGIPGSVEARLEIFYSLMQKAEEYGIGPERIYIDPVAEMLCTSDQGAMIALDVIRKIRKACPGIHIMGAVSNVSWHLPKRPLINRAFAVLGMQAGLDCLMLDPGDHTMMGLIYAADALLGRDEYCLEYIQAYRDGCI